MGKKARREMAMTMALAEVERGERLDEHLIDMVARWEKYLRGDLDLVSNNEELDGLIVIY